MAETLVNLYEAKAALSRLVDRAAAGEEIIIAKNGRPMARLTAATRRAARRRPGGWKGKVFIGRNFDSPLPAAIEKAFGTPR
jgi:prevent-host-death family protein